MTSLASGRAGSAEARAAGPLIIIDSDDEARVATRCLLEREGYRVMSFESVETFLDAPFVPRPCGLIFDVQTPGRNGLDMLRQLGGREDHPPILIVSAQADLDVAVAAMKLGASDFVQKPYAPEELLGAVANLTRLGIRREAESARDEEMAALVESLSRRQRQILARIARGDPNKIIASDLDLSIRTVESYRADLFKRLGIKGVAEAVRIAVAAGLGVE